jgi:hypothetical protein
MTNDRVGRISEAHPPRPSPIGAPDTAAPYPACERATARGRTVPSGTGPR